MPFSLLSSKRHSSDYWNSNVKNGQLLHKNTYLAHFEAETWYFVFYYAHFLFTFYKCCIGFCHTTPDHACYTYSPPPSWASLPPHHLTSVGHHRLLDCTPYLPAAPSHQLSILLMIVDICWCYFLHSSHSLPPQCVHKCTLYICISIPFWEEMEI